MVYQAIIQYVSGERKVLKLGQCHDTVEACRKATEKIQLMAGWTIVDLHPNQRGW